MTANATAERVLDAAMYLAKRRGLNALTRDAIALQARVSTGTVSTVFVNMDGLLTAVVKKAIADNIWPVIMQAIALKHPAVKGLSKDQKLHAMATLL